MSTTTTIPATVAKAYDMHRWYENPTGRYSSADPLPMKPAPLPYVYGASRPAFYTDSLGLAPVHNGSPYPIPYKPDNGEDFGICLPGEDCDADGVYPPTCSGFPIKVVDGCNGEIGVDGKLRVYCPFFNGDAPDFRRKFPYLGQATIGGPTNADFHKKHPDWPVPNGKPFCGCDVPAGSSPPPGAGSGLR